MKSSLSMILPVHNAQADLSRLIAQVVEVLPELTPRWDLLVVDDGSTDATPEVAEEWTRAYPQVRVAHHAKRAGREGWQRTGVLRTRGDVLLFRDEECPVDLTGVHKMWKRIVSSDVVVTRAAKQAALAWLASRSVSRKSARSTAGGLQMIRRRVLDDWAPVASRESLSAYLAGKGCRQHEVELQPARHSIPTPLRPAAVSNVDTDSTIRPSHRDEGDKAGQPRRPNYLVRLRAFATGE
ncbi:MAG: glycosyltransferase [Planctomycetia bacterium]|nr:glycosyltransferase [Planctomycetia bacterium]